ncbi:tubulin binding cofactor A [Lentinus tigrinus ALCF2SS1-6]|uniref:Tubulin-specific chaperone A n=1 Tax=Lentinus tigrinus ALCF2SS1-6 TaxID=1328759 RepID=A0A5C2SP02_9APHY|nr:tubulin binding cofactor A [Lentinus tigrinus ALCF2SS1-6]
MSDANALRKQLKIKAGSAKRLFKEHKLYQKEEEELKLKLDKYIENNAEDWDIKNTRRMLEESGKMITDSADRLGNVMQDLRELLVSAERNPELSQDEEVLKAQETLEEVSI